MHKTYAMKHTNHQTHPAHQNRPPMKTVRKTNLLATLFAFLAASASAWAANVTWNNSTGNGLWSDPGNWAGGALPGEGDVAVIGSNVTLDADATVLGVSLSGSPVIEGAGHRLTVLNGTVTGGSKPVVKCKLVFPEGVAATARPAQGYGNIMTIEGGIDGGASVASTGGNQNFNIRFTNETIRTGALLADFGTTFFSPLDVSSITLSDPWADANGNSPTFTFWPSATLADDTVVTTKQGVVTLAFTDQYETAPVTFTVPKLHLASAGRTSLSCNFYGVQNFVRINAFERDSGAMLHVNNRKLGSSAFNPGVNAGIFIQGIPTDAQGRVPAWAYNDSYRIKVLENGALAPVAYNDYANLAAEIAVNDPTGLYRLHYVQDSALTADTDIDSLIMNGNFNSTDDNTMRLDLGDYDLRLHGGALALRDYASKELSASGDGALVIAADQAVFNFTYDVARIEISAPIEWEKPAGSTVDYPDFLMPYYSGAETIFSGEDRVGDWGALSADGRNKGGSLLIFDGPSDRTFHGPVGGRFWMRKRGTGTLTFAGPDITRGRQIFVEDGTVVIADDHAPRIDCVTNGATLRIAKDVVWTQTAVVWNDSVLEGFGTLQPGLNQNYLQPGCILRGGTASEPGTFSFGGQVVTPTNLVLDIGFKGDTHGQIAVGGKQTFRSNLNTAIKIRVSDVDGTPDIKPTDTFTVYSWLGSTENYTSNRVSLAIENATPRRLNTTGATAAIDTATKTIKISGLRSKRGIVIVVR